MHTVTVIIHCFRVFPQQLKKKNKGATLRQWDLTRKVTTKIVLAWLDFSFFWWQVSVYESQTPIQFYNECPVYSIDASS